MPEQYSGFLVILAENLDADEAQDVITALKQIKGVIDVQPNVATPAEYIALLRARTQLVHNILQAIAETK